MQNLRRLARASAWVLAALLSWAGPAGASGTGPSAYRLVDQAGATFTLADLRGRPVFVTFVASRCVDACPLVNAIFYQLQERLRHERLRAHLVTITLDPEYDTPFVTAAMARRYAADEPTWRVASGEPRVVRKLMRAFGVEAVKDRAGIPDVHSTFVYMLDPHGRLARTLLASTTLADQAAKLVKAARPPPR
jgi:protein SCO1/2